MVYIVVYKSGPLVFKGAWTLFQNVDLSLQDSGPFICEGGSSKSTEPPWLWACFGTPDE